MSSRQHSRPLALKTRAAVFAALGDETRLAVLARLAEGTPQSISRLTEGTGLSRQAVTKHLRVLEKAGMLRHSRSGRESLFALEPQPIAELRDYLDEVASHWDAALARLKAQVEGEDVPTSRGSPPRTPGERGR